MATIEPSYKKILKLDSGAQWLKADLHLHTPASRDFEGETDTKPEDIVAIALEKELGVIAITDHHSVAWCDKVRQAAKGSRLVVFPGVEVSTKEGHILAIFDVNEDATRIEDFLIRVGVPREEFGNHQFSIPMDFEGIAKEIENSGGIAIAAHADGKRGFLTTIQTGLGRRAAYLSNSLWAIESIKADMREKHQSGQVYPPRHMTCLQFSDSHDPLRGMGSRSTFLKMGETNLSGLKLALLDPAIRVAFSKDEFSTPECIILGMWVTNGFLNGQVMRFNEGVNCLIGDTGSGKSLSVELIRYALDQQPVVCRIKKEVENLLVNQLGEEGSIHVIIGKGSQRYLVERPWSNTPSNPFVQRIEEDSSLTPIEVADMHAFFPVKCFSQGEIIEFARDNRVRLTLTDDLIDVSAELEAIDETKGKLRRNAESIIAEEDAVKSMQEQTAKLPTLKETLSGVEKSLPKERVEEQNQLAIEQKLLEQISEKLESLPEKIADAMTSFIRIPDQDGGPGFVPHSVYPDELRTALRIWQSLVKTSQRELEEGLEELVCTFSGIYQERQTLYKRKTAENLKALEDLDLHGEGLSSLEAHRKRIQGQINEMEGKRRLLEQEMSPRIERLRDERNDLLHELQALRRQITCKREEKSRDLNAKLNGAVRLRVHSRADSALFMQNLTDIAEGSRLGKKNTELIGKVHPIHFVKEMLNEDFDEVERGTQVPAARLNVLWDTILRREKLSDLYELQIVDVEDVIEVNFRVTQGTYKNLEDLSHGQRCRVILMIALAEGKFPLVVDQPEDALHAPGIEEGIVYTLRMNRGERQCIFATRNANILVSADTEQIVALEADAISGQVKSTGSLDRYDHNELVIYNVEGGREAFRRRNSMYTLSLSDISEK